jgi:hypothetical protein
VNEDTIELCPEESMQFGRALLRILQQIARSDPRLGRVYLSKIDIVDGFYCIAIRVEAGANHHTYLHRGPNIW